MPGNLYWEAVTEKGDVVGYTAVRQFTNNNGKGVQLGLSPLYANNDRIAKSLLKLAAKTYQSNETTSASRINLFYDDGESCGHHASQLMQKLEATAFHLDKGCSNVVYPLVLVVSKKECMALSCQPLTD